MQQLWAPWRMQYIESDKSGPCVLCAKPAEGDDRRSYILERAEHSFVMMNIYPYSSGHLMVSPYAHVDRLAALDDATALDLTRTLGLMHPPRSGLFQKAKQGHSVVAVELIRRH